MKSSLFFMISLFLFLDFSLKSQELFQPLRTNEPPEIDGRLNDAVWQKAPEITGFKTFIPDFGRDISEKTSAYMAYDSRYLYFAFRCFDRDPAKIKATMASRDTIMTDDFVCINLDSFNDQQSLYAFYANPLGIQGDSRFSSNKEDFSVDFVWSSAGQRDDKGYAVEMRIPFKSIRYAGKERVEMAIFFERYISRTTEHVSYPALKPEKGYAFLTQMMPFELRDIKQYTLLEILPAFVFSQKHEQEGGSLHKVESHEEFGVTGKAGLTSKLILDAAWNPDFSQIESDAGQVDANLRYDLFYPEKRPFFLEGSEIFLHAGASPLQAVVHTRQIIDPSLGFKLSGKLGKKDTISAIFAVDEVEDNPLHQQTDAKNAGFYIFRYKRALKNDGYIGVFYTGREQGEDYNRIAGMDGQIRLSPSGMLNFFGFASFTDNLSLPDADGYALNAGYAYSTRNLDYGGGAYVISRDFFSESGYLTRRGLTGFRAEAAPKFYPKSKFFRKIQPRLFANMIRDHFSGMNESSAGLGADFLFPGNTTATVESWAANEIFLSRRFNTSGCSLIISSWLNKKLLLYLGFRWENLIRYVSDPFQGNGSKVVALVKYLPSEKFEWESRLIYADFFSKVDSLKVYDYTILRNKLTFQMNKFLFFRGVVEYNSYWKKLLTDFLASFTYIPGTVIQLGYGSLYNKLRWEDGSYRDADRFLEMKRGLFFKASYLWRL